MNYLFSINKKGTVILHPDCLKLCNEFAYLTEKEILCIILAYDYYSPYRQFTEDQRKPRALTHVYGPGAEDIFKKEKIKKGVECYRSLQFDVRREQIIAYEKKLASINEMVALLEDDDLKKLKDIINTSKELRKAVEEIEKELIHEEESVLTETEDKVKLSFLEKLTSNREKYLEVTRKRDGLRNT